MRALKKTPQVEREQRRAYLVNEYCESMRISRAKVYEMMRDGELPYITVGGRRRISADVVEAQIRGELPGQERRPSRPPRRRSVGHSDV